MFKTLMLRLRRFQRRSSYTFIKAFFCHSSAAREKATEEEDANKDDARIEDDSCNLPAKESAAFRFFENMKIMGQSCSQYDS